MVSQRRTCVGCRRVAGPDELVRVARRPDGALAVGRHEPGRGAWLCPEQECFETATRRKAFRAALRCEVTTTDLAELRGRLVMD